MTRNGYMTGIKRPFQRVVDAAGLDPKEVIRHTTRHTAITHLVQANIDLPTVQRISGHSDIKMVARYAHQDSDHLRTAMDKLQRRYKKKASKAEVPE
jgi:site-specific recombinase XerD